MNIKDKINAKNKALKSAIERYNVYERFVSNYKKSKSVEEYITYISNLSSGMSDDTRDRFNSMIRSHELGNDEPILSHMYERLLAADEYKRKVADELKSLLREL